ncbi:MAG: 16S rRNA (cytosine(1402)-N(4))-methyltransferase RsmH [Rectinemataceae bacterium]|nr:16S rRNA (cytosine(1402)-N(4))-methyltransferase RsmH [Rectinemataceae bacterium]
MKPLLVHCPVMLVETLEWLVPGSPDAFMLDCTLGEGGHAEAFLSKYPELLYAGIDADPVIQAKARERLTPFAPRVTFLSGYFDEVLAGFVSDSTSGSVAGARLADGSIRKPDLVLFDLGISMHHFALSGLGFGHGKDEFLDMRLSPDASRSASDIVNRDREEELARIIFEYGEERYSRRIAKAIVDARRMSPVTTTARLADVVASAVPATYRNGRFHCATRTFQALRIAVNDELGRAERGIRAAASLLAPGGRIAVISFHSLEDRISKNVFRNLALASKEAGIGDGCRFTILTRKPLEPTQDEARRNPPSRSAKLRVLELTVKGGGS